MWHGLTVTCYSAVPTGRRKRCTACSNTMSCSLGATHMTSDPKMSTFNITDPSADNSGTGNQCVHVQNASGNSLADPTLIHILAMHGLQHGMLLNGLAVYWRPGRAA